MPRDVGTGIYFYPSGTKGNPGQTIFSTRYNTFLDDLTNTLNQALPVNMGGTGGASAATARANIGCEVSSLNQIVTNYDIQVWESGSFASSAGAQGAPTAAEHFMGVAVLLNATQQYINLRAVGNATGKTYTRLKQGGVWAAWTAETDVLNNKVSKTGDTMTGPLQVSNGISVVGQVGALVANSTVLDTSSGSSRVMAFGPNTSTVGQLSFNLFSSNASVGGAVMTLNAIGASFSGTITSGAIQCPVVQIKAATAADNAQINLVTETGSQVGYVFWKRSDGSLNIQNSAPYSIAMNASGYVDLARGFRGRRGISDVFTPYIHNFEWTSLLYAWVEGTNVGYITLTSDYRIKKDVIDLPGMWDTVKALRPIKYTQAQYTPQHEIKRKLEEAQAARAAGLDTPEAKEGYEITPMFAADNIERWGFIAHELQQALLPTAASGVKDQPDAIQSLNLAPVVAALTKALQEAMTRIEALEAAQATP